MFGILKKKDPSLLSVKIEGEEISRVGRTEIPCEKVSSKRVSKHAAVEFVDALGARHTHSLGAHEGWFHFSIRVHPNLACQADCVITDSKQYEPEAYMKGKASGIRFQPFFLAGAKVNNGELAGKGLFARGLHFSGTVTNGNVMLSCECEYCRRSFLVNSYHAGFSQSGYFYSASGKYTIVVDNQVPGSPVALSSPNPEELAALEAALPRAPDGSTFNYFNPFRCPHCSKPYIDFEANPGTRGSEYYGNYFVGSELLRYPLA